MVCQLVASGPKALLSLLNCAAYTKTAKLSVTVFSCLATYRLYWCNWSCCDRELGT